MKNTKIALVQMQSLVDKIDINLDKIEEFIIRAAKDQVDIICFPEASITGYSKEARPLEKYKLDNISHYFKDLSAKYSIAILVGLIEDNPDNKPYITHLVIRPDGKVNSYRKSHLGESEKNHFSSGNDLPVFTTPKANIGIQICWESHFPEISTVMALKGADIIFMPFASPVSSKNRKDIWLKYLTARAYDNSVFVAACNSMGNNNEGTILGGGALVLDPKGELIAEDFNGEEGMLIAELDSNSIDAIRNQNISSMANRYYLKNRRPELYKDVFTS